MPEVQTTRRLELLMWAGFGAVLLFFLALKSFCLHWQVSDENIYYYMAWAVVDHGALPYRDFFFAHPPLHLLPGVILFGVLGFGPLTARLIPVGASVVAATFLFLLARQRLGRVAAVATVALYLSSFDVLGASTHWTGIDLAVMWLVIGLWALSGRRDATAGIMLALGVGTGNYVLPAAVMAGLLAFLQKTETGTRYAIGFAVPWLAIQMIGVSLGGYAYLDSVYRFHFLKPAESSGGVFSQVLTDNFALFLGAALGLVLAETDRFLGQVTSQAAPPLPAADGVTHAAARGLWSVLRDNLVNDGARGIARCGALWGLGYALFLATLPMVFPFYFLAMFPGLALTAGFAVERFVRHGVGLLRSAGQRDRQWWEAARILAMVGIAAAAGEMLRLPLQRSLLPTYVRTRDTPMQWSDSPLPINSLLRWCCWDDIARAYTGYGTVQENLYHESRYFEAAEGLADYVAGHSRPDQVLFGDSGTAGVVALLAGRRLAGDFADTNIMRFSSGVSVPREVIQQIDTPALAFVLVQGRSASDQSGQGPVRYGAFASEPAFRDWLDGGFEVAYRVDDRTKGTFLLLKPKQ